LSVLPEVSPLPAASERFAWLFDRLIADGFSDITGADASITLPLSKRLLNDLIAAAMPSSIPIRDLDVTPLENDRFVVRGRFGSSALIPTLKLHVAIEQQPVFPASPVFVVRLEGQGVMLFVGRALRMISLPRWLHVEQDRLHVDLRELAVDHRLDRYLNYIDELRVNTVAGTAVLSLRGRVR
jgi:hypothetical protein